ncbi:MAG TPA: fused MFS/spermidine synthase [Polyangia bacterium]|nr:fused MFS/spermidine synthase [Polyangia bacterium]
MKRSLALPSLLLAATGAAALTYEIVWTRWLQLALGAGAASLAIVVASTMLGFAAGGELGGRLADRGRRRMRLYGRLELGVAVSALAASALLRTGAAAELAVRLPRPLALCAALALLALPTALMGATLPALAAHVGRSADGLRVGVSRLYAANTTGAVVGALGAGFWLIQRLGLWGAALAAASVNGAAGLCALAADRGTRATNADRAEPMADEPALAAGGAALVGAAASGFLTLGNEVLSTRLLVHGLLSTTHAIAIILAAFLAGLALGAHLIAGRVRAAGARLGTLGAALIVAAAMSLALAPLEAHAAGLVDALRGRDVRFGVRLFAEAAVAGSLLLPATTVMGFSFPLAAVAYAALARPGRTVGRVVLVNTLFGVAGALVAGLVLLPLLGLRGALVAVALSSALVGAWLCAREPGWRARGRRLAWAALGALAIYGALWARPPRLDAPPGQGTLVAQHVVGHEADYRVRCYREGSVATTYVLEHLPSRRRDLLIDGFVAAGNADGASYMTLMGRLPLLLHPQPRRVLVICFGSGATARAAADAAPDLALFDVVDLDPNVFACAPAFGPQNLRVLARAGVHVDDGRRFLRRTGPSYDVITQEPMPPHFAGTSALYSVEYYRLARRRLAPGGVLVQWLPLHLLAPLDARQIAAAAATVFPETWLALAPGDQTGLLVSSPEPLDPERRTHAQATLHVEFVLDPAALARFVGGADPVTDDRPSLEYSGVDRALGRFRSARQLLLYNLEQVRRASKL